MKKIAGHTLLAQLGKKRLRPGGKVGTNWLIEQGEFSKDKKVLEVACNMGTTLVEIYNRFNPEIIGVDRDEKALEKAKENLKENSLEDKIKVLKADARDLPFDDNTFDIVINEAMLTMLSDEDKEKAVKEYYRVLKPNGVLLTHDVNIRDTDPGLVEDLRTAIHVPAKPLMEEDWLNLFKKAGFKDIKHQHDNMRFLSDAGMKKDEGEDTFKAILENAKDHPMAAQFKLMREFFSKNEGRLHYIVVASRK